VLLFGLQIRRETEVDRVVVTLGVTVRTSRPRQPAKCLPADTKFVLDVDGSEVSEMERNGNTESHGGHGRWPVQGSSVRAM
jgi:hypothetical protein